MIDRSEISRALAKSLAYKEAGNHREAKRWAVELVRLLKRADILPEGDGERTEEAGRASGRGVGARGRGYS